jgi:deoxyribose-phosphate aldolase
MTDMYPPIGEQIQLLLSSLPVTLPPIDPTPSLPRNVASIIDHTLLAPASTPVDIRQCCKEAVTYNAATVCVNSSMVALAAEALQGTGVKPICTIGFPFGAGNTQSKVLECSIAKEQGAQEIDMVRQELSACILDVHMI